MLVKQYEVLGLKHNLSGHETQFGAIRDDLIENTKSKIKVEDCCRSPNFLSYT